MAMKTPLQYLQEAKEQIAKRFKYESWREYENIGTQHSIYMLNEAALLAIENAQRDAQPKWIDVNDNLPNERLQAVLLFNGDAPEYNQHIFRGVWFNQSQTFKPDVEYTFIGTITHWQPLPSPPKQLEP